MVQTRAPPIHWCYLKSFTVVQKTEHPSCNQTLCQLWSTSCVLHLGTICTSSRERHAHTSLTFHIQRTAVKNHNHGHKGDLTKHTNRRRETDTSVTTNTPDETASTHLRQTTRITMKVFSRIPETSQFIHGTKVPKNITGKRVNTPSFNHNRAAYIIHCHLPICFPSPFKSPFIESSFLPAFFLISSRRSSWQRKSP